MPAYLFLFSADLPGSNGLRARSYRVEDEKEEMREGGGTEVEKEGGRKGGREGVREGM
jgi:hypothetical protein